MKDGEVMCITKGADSIMEKLLVSPLGKAEQDHLMQFSKVGLRTLVVASKSMSFTEFKEWERHYLNACGIMDDTRDAAVAHICAQMEYDLDYVGITAVEDRLQDGVPEAIVSIKRAGVRLWMLTGDKTETAVDIARSCNLFTEETTISYVTGCESLTEASLALERAKKELSGASTSGLVLDGRAVHEILENDDCKDMVLELGLGTQSCVCCRLSPAQKRKLVELVTSKTTSTVALAIGDGANDVPMIEGAHIGVGIRGKEGAQAVQVADVAISQFRFLVPLLLCHGRRSYWRAALFLNYYLYKSLALAMGDVIWMHQNAFKGGIAFPEYLSVNYNVFFTSWHVVLVLAFDHGVSNEAAISRPEMYLVGPQRKRFNPIVFFIWMAHGVLHGSVCWLLPNLWFGGTYYVEGKDSFWKNKASQASLIDIGQAEDFWVASCASFCLIVIVCILKLLLEVQRPYSPSSALPSIGAKAFFPFQRMKPMHLHQNIKQNICKSI
jgi:magnesium-transporting ATPase (P-type)